MALLTLEPATRIRCALLYLHAYRPWTDEAALAPYVALLTAHGNVVAGTSNPCKLAPEG